ncbi:MAG: DDE-type integrase/transposase/recombinase [Sphingomonadaceae bacterium]
MEEVQVKIAGKKFWLWRAVDQHGLVLEEILQNKRDKRVARHLLVKLIKRHQFLPMPMQKLLLPMFRNETEGFQGI